MTEHLIDHIAILVSDLKIAEEWYTENLKGKITFRNEKYIRISVANTNIALIDKKHYDKAHFAILVDNFNELPLNKGEIIKHRDGTVGVFIKDPFGNYIEYIWYSEDNKKVFLND